MKYTWLTDIHLNFLNENERKHFYKTLIQDNSDIVFITGDIAEAPSLTFLLKEMAGSIQKKIYFVLGNHDYYRGQINQTRNEMIKLTESDPWLKWLPACDPTSLDKSTVLIGEDGWADGRYGDYENSNISLNDSLLIADLFQEKIISKHALLEKMQQLADDDAKKLFTSLKKAVSVGKTKKIIILTHIPPFKEACLHKGKISDDNWLPYFSSKATGDVLINFAPKNPDIECLTYCGHTHSPAHYQPLKNLRINTGGAEYYRPELQQL